MGTPLDGCAAKLERANETIGNLNTGIAAFFSKDPKPYEVIREFNKDGLEYSFIVKGDPAVPLRFAVLTGEVIHHLRSSLDHLVAALVWHNGKSPTVLNQFPICSTSEEFDTAIKRHRLDGLSPSAVDLIRQQQPHLSPTPEDHFLVPMHKLDIEDKHRLPLLTVAAATFAGKVILGTDEEITRKLGIEPGRLITNFGDFRRKKISKDGVKVFTIHLAEPDPTFKAEGDVVMQVVFEKLGLTRLIPVTNALTGMSEATSALIGKLVDEFN